MISKRTHHPNPDAYALVLRVRRDQSLFRSDSATRAAVNMLGRAVAADSLFPTAFAELSRAYNAVCMGRALRSVRLVACDSGALAARHAIALDSTVADGYSALAWASLNRLDFSTADAAARRAVAMEPNNSKAHQLLAVVDFWFGRVDEAIAEARRAVELLKIASVESGGYRDGELNPPAIDAVAEYGQMLAWAGREEEALVVMQPLRSLRPKVRRVTGIVGSIYEQRKMWRDAMVEAVGDSTRIARILAESGRGAEARAILKVIETRWNRGHGRASDVADVYFALHAHDSAFTWLDRSIDDLSLRANVLGPAFADARSDLRFQALMGRLGLPQRR
jgi:serine/threonine-protein kinase